MSCISVSTRNQTFFLIIFFCFYSFSWFKAQKKEKDTKTSAQKPTAQKPIIKPSKKIKSTKGITIPCPELTEKDLDYQKFLGNKSHMYLKTDLTSLIFICNNVTIC